MNVFAIALMHAASTLRAAASRIPLSSPFYCGRGRLIDVVPLPFILSDRLKFHALILHRRDK